MANFKGISNNPNIVNQNYIYYLIMNYYTTYKCLFEKPIKGKNLN